MSIAPLAAVQRRGRTPQRNEVEDCRNPYHQRVYEDFLHFD